MDITCLANGQRQAATFN